MNFAANSNSLGHSRGYSEAGSDHPSGAAADDSAAGDRPLENPSTPSAPSAPLPLWYRGLQQSSHGILAMLEPETLSIQSASDYFYQFTGLPQPDTSTPTLANEQEIKSQASLLRLLSPADREAIARLCRYHILYRLLQHLFQQGTAQLLPHWRMLDEPLGISMPSADLADARYLQVWIRSNLLQVDLPLDGPAAARELLMTLGLDPASPQDCLCWLNHGDRLQQLEDRILSCSYRLSGSLLWEGIDFTAQELMRRITQLLVDQNSVLQAEKFEQVNGEMCRLFRADNTVIVCFQGHTARLFTGQVSPELDRAEYSFEALKGGQMMQAIASQAVLAVPDLAEDCVTELGRKLVNLGVRSLLLVPLLAEQTGLAHRFSQPIGLIGLLSHQPHHFDSVDCLRANQMIPAFAAALTTALRQLHQKRFLNSIHPAVEWRFIQEAERRSLGFPPEPLVFHEVFPLYGISDIRGSSQERNRAIQQDLTRQLQLGLAIIEAVRAAQPGAFCEQLQMDLRDTLARLQEGVTVDAEVTISRYLGDRLEAHFDYFSACSPEAKAAVEAYRNACTPGRGGVYEARARYDFLLTQINSRLRDTWEQWQARMQKIIPHYCDVEVTDGIDHMIYAGASIATDFSPFHLRSLRYEQLRAICACARTAFDVQAEFQSDLEVTHLVLVQDSTVDIFHDEDTERLFDVRGTRDTRYEIVKKRIDKAIDADRKTRITQPGMLTVVYSTEQEEKEYREYLRYLARENLVSAQMDSGLVEPLQGVSGLKFMRVEVLAIAHP